jgi:hypothetical protein
MHATCHFSVAFPTLTSHLSITACGKLGALYSGLDTVKIVAFDTKNFDYHREGWSEGGGGREGGNP